MLVFDHPAEGCYGNSTEMAHSQDQHRVEHAHPVPPVSVATPTPGHKAAVGGPIGGGL